ncbi:MAG TPA: S8 family serine peptidase [Candidatus Competibacteraceae bacterium]|nr:S8 family serine peptidase [Candidatus Competibacteraceae bacterium]HRZ06088.1 S8 family serine peptidase [Candidatus Competibacteraceae bacterium]HSA46055.1 S8 family serine peptidase [Candidatus Competibacteraceae bacterium]
MWKGNVRRGISLACAALLALGACVAPLEQTPPETISEPGVPKQLQSRQIIVALAEKERPQWPAITQELQGRYQLRSVGEFPLTSIGVQCLVFQVPSGQSLEATIDQLQADPRIALAQPNQAFEGLQAADDSTVGYVALAYGVKLIGADRAWRVSTGRGVPVVVIDTGADIDHPALRSQGIKTANFVEGGESSFATDRHGTAIAGVISAHPIAGVRIDGVAPDVALTVAKACWYPEPTSAKARCSSWTLAKAIDFAINGGARVINLSLGGRPDELLARLLTAAEHRGVTVVAATLENQDDPGFPAALDTVIPVIACDADRRVAWPRWRTLPFVVAAPGVEIVAPAPHNRYDLLSGSSLAAAHVTGVVALLVQQEPQRRPDQIREILRATAQQATTVSHSTPLAIGIVDACAALARHTPLLACY